MAKVGGWLASLLAVIIGGYAVWYLTTPHPKTFEGMVYADSVQVPGAMVTLHMGGDGVSASSYHDVTDEHGSFHFEAADLSRSTDVTLTVVARGYAGGAPVSVAKPLQADNRIDIPLTPIRVIHPVPEIPPIHAPGVEPGTQPAHAPGVQMLPRYLPKLAAVQISAKK